MTAFRCPQPRKGRAVGMCPVCKARHRSVRTAVYGLYAVDDVCCGCGTLWCDMERVNDNGQRARAERAKQARAEWPTLPRWRDVVRREAEAMEVKR